MEGSAHLIVLTISCLSVRAETAHPVPATDAANGLIVVLTSMFTTLMMLSMNTA